MNRTTRYILTCVATIVLSVRMVAWAEDNRKPGGEDSAKGGWDRDPISQMVFFAVFEGLYADGVSNDVVDIIIPPDPKTGQPMLTEHFVYSCPLCHPAFEAFRLYRQRLPFFGQKASYLDTFGRGLSADIVHRLHSTVKTERLDAIQQLVTTWVARRLDAMRLTPQERREWERRLQAQRDRGKQALDGFLAAPNGAYFKNVYSGWKKCAICEGSLGACRRQPEPMMR